MQPKLSTALAVCGNVLVDALVADGCLAGNLDWAPLFCRQACFHWQPTTGIDPSSRARYVPAPCALALCGSSQILVHFVRIAPKLAADRCRGTLHLSTDFTGRETAIMKVLNLVAFVLAQVRVAHVQFHLAVKLCRLPRLSRSTAWSGALQN